MPHEEDFVGCCESRCPKHGKQQGSIYRCWQCGGEGTIEVDDWEGFDTEEENCDICKGDGVFWVCSKCSEEGA